MVRELRQRHGDRFTEYFSPESLESFNQAIEGRFSGVGLSVVPVKRGLRAVQVFPGSPADKAGIERRRHDRLGRRRLDRRREQHRGDRKIKGPEGTEVTIGVRDGKSGKVRQLRLTRAEVALPNVSSKVETVDGRKLGYVRMLSFSEGVHALLADAVRKVEREGAEGIVLDLRGNPGGLLDEAVLSASVFLPEGEVVVSTDSRTQGDSVHKTVGGNLPRRPMVVLIDRNTASAAEILAAALADDAGAPVVGTRSFGKGVFQEEKRPRQRRRPEADGRRVLHPRRGQPGAQPRDPPRRQGQRRPGNAGGRGESSGRSACWPVGSGVEPAPPGAAGRASGREPAPPAPAPRRASAARRAERPRRGRGAAARAARLPRLPRRARGRGASGRRARPSADAGARRDLTALATFTVDPASARDFDDAVSAQREGDGARVWIHIADVAAHVRPGSPLDLEARRRANSTYVPGAVEPMLPHALSSDACSLAPGVERLAVTAEIELGPGAEPRSTRFYRSRIRSDARLDYDQLDAIFAGRAAPPAEVAEPLAAARDVAARARRAPRRQQPRRRIARAGVPLRRRRQRGRRPPRRPDRGAPADRAADDPHQRAGGRSGCSASGCRRSTASTRARPDPDRAPGRAAGGARGADAAARARGSRPRRREWSPPRRAGSPGARPSGADTAGRRIPRSCSAPSSRPPTASATAATPASAAPPTRTSPRRSAATPTWSCTGRCWRRWGRGRRRRGWPRPARSPPTARPASASRRRSSAAPTTSAPPTCSNASSASAASTPSSRARSPA